MLDADARSVLDLFEASGRPPMHEMSVEEARAAVRASRESLGLPPPSVEERNLTVDGPGGPVPIRFYRPLNRTSVDPLPLLLYFHGGGWMTGDLEYGAWFCATLAERVGIAVASVDYRLAPEHPFPAGLDDCLSAVNYCRDQAAALGVDADRVALCGDSAGGNLAAVSALWARDQGVRLRAQILIYPVTDLLEESPTYRSNGDGYGLSAETMRWFCDAYRNGADASDWRLSPARAVTLKGLAPALVLTCGYDPLRGEGDAYAARLAGEGVPVHHIRFDDQIHGFLMWAQRVRAAETALRRIADELQTRLGVSPLRSEA